MKNHSHLIKPKIITFYYGWPSTKNNHAGMAYFCKCLKKDLGFPVKPIHGPDYYLRYGLQQLWHGLTMRRLNKFKTLGDSAKMSRYYFRNY